MINLGIIGSGNIVQQFIDATKSIENINLYALYSRTEEKTREFKEKYNFKKTYTNLEEMSLDENLDAVYIASPNSLHYSQSILFLKNKKHILCEKAFASNSREVLEMIETSKENNVILMEAIRTTHLPNFYAVKDNLHKIGKVRKYFASFCQYSSRYDKFKEGIVLNAFKKELSNGSLMDIGVYTIYPLIELFGMPLESFSTAYKLSTGADGQGSTIFKYDEMDAVVMFSKISNSSLPSEIIGENGSIVIDKINDFKSVKIIYNDKTVEDISVNQEENDLLYEINEFVSLIENNDAERAYEKLNTSLEVMKSMDKIRKDIDLVYPADK